MSEKRVHSRFEVSLTAQLPGAARGYEFRIADLSVGGCYIDSIAEVMVDEILSIRILKPDNQWFELRGQVTHHFPRLGFGIRFLNVAPAELEEIQLLLAEAGATYVTSAVLPLLETLLPVEQLESTLPGLIMHRAL
jgi:PilZ domain